MELVDPKIVLDDYSKVLSSSDNIVEHYSNDIKAYFGGMTERVPLSNNHGHVACSEYVEFVSSMIFCPDGSWLGYETPSEDNDAAKKKQEMLQKVVTALSHSNFYSQMTKLITSGVLRNKGLIDIQWDKGLQFNSLEGEDIICSTHSEPSCQRAYAGVWMTKEEVVLSFDYDEYDIKKADQMNEMVKVITCIIPTSKMFFTKENRTYSHKKVYLLQDGGKLVELKKPGKKKDFLFKTFPIMSYSPHMEQPLAYLALVSAVKLEMYEDLMGEQARKTLNPPMYVPQEILTNGPFDLGEKGIVPAPTGTGIIPTPIETKLQMQLTMQDIQRHEAKIDRVFKIPLIERLKVTNVTQFEYAGNLLAAFKAISPAAADLLIRIPSILLSRVHSLLKQHDKEYGILAGEIGGELDMGGLSMNLKKLETATSLGRIAQGIAPYLQAYPEDKGSISGGRAIQSFVEAWGQSHILSSEEEQQAEMETIEQQQDTQQQEQSALNAAQTQNLLQQGAQNEG